nr:1752_t:CDS:2 [Entrophospora candida]
MENLHMHGKDSSTKAGILAHYVRFNINTSVIKKGIEEIKKRQEEYDKKRHADEYFNRIKKVKLSIEEWKTCPTINTEAKKGKFIRDNGKFIEFPFERLVNLDMSNHRKGKFLNSPDPDDEENLYQQFFMKQRKGLIKHLDVDLYAYYSHNVSLLNSQKPDVFLFGRVCLFDPLNVEIVLELKTKHRNDFRNEEIGHIAAFAEKALQLQPQRSFIYGVLTDCYDIMFIKVQRSTIFSDDFTNKFKYELTKKELLKYGNQGCNCFATLLVQKSEQLGWIKQQSFYEEHGSVVTLKRCIGHGRTCHVFSGESHDSSQNFKA